MTPSSQSCRTLWVAVLARALIDASRADDSAPNAAEKLARVQAREWLTRGGADFQRVCEMAGLNAARVKSVLSRGDVSARVKAYLRSLSKQDNIHGKEL